MKTTITNQTRATGANPAAAAEPLLYTRRQAARLLGVSSAYVYAAATRGELACVELPSRGGRRRGRMMFTAADLQSLIERNRRASS